MTLAWQDKKIVVLGLGLSGLSCVRYLAKQGLTFIANDSRPKAVDSRHFSQEFAGAKLIQGHWAKAEIEQADIVLVSPGIDLIAEGIQAWFKASCQVMGDIELFAQLIAEQTQPPKVIAVTGSNGKSTVVSLIKHVADSLGFSSLLAGNIGTPILDAYQADADLDYVILELSSFQLETVRSLKPAVACVLNVSDDHLDRHGTLEQYAKIKQKIYHQADVIVFNADDALTQPTTTNAKQLSFSSHNHLAEGYLGQVEQESYLFWQQQPVVALASLPLLGLHNGLNYLAVIAISQSLSWPLAQVVQACSNFYGLSHRCQLVPTLDGLRWVNDSKATNVGATLAALSGFNSVSTGKGQLWLIVGGQAKGADVSPLVNEIKHANIKAVAFGQDAALFTNQLQQIQLVADLSEAVNYIKQHAEQGDTVLLSPACASLDMFKNYMERGDKFVELVQQSEVSYG